MTIRSTRGEDKKGPKKDKFNVFEGIIKEILNEKENDNQINLVVVGDSSEEIKAAKAVRDKYKEKVIVKTVKFIKKPTIEQLTKEIALTREKIVELVESQSNEDYVVEETMREGQPSLHLVKVSQEPAEDLTKQQSSEVD